MAMTHSNASQMTHRSPQDMTGAYGEPRALTQMLEFAAANYNLVSPTTACASLPDGCEVVLSSVLIDAKNETYDVMGGKKGLGKNALDRIAAAAGISWLPDQSRRLDDGSDPRYVLYKAIGVLRSFDGTEQMLIGTKEMDLRDGAPQCEAIVANAREGKDPSIQIREMRLHILAHAESKARLRAIRSIGIRSSYAAQDLAKPFVIARLMLTGATADPELRRAIAMERTKAMLGPRALYGAAPLPAQGVALDAPRPPPPVGARPADDDEGIGLGDPLAPPVGSAPQPPAQSRPPGPPDGFPARNPPPPPGGAQAPQQPPPSPAAGPQQTTLPGTGGTPASGFTIPFGRTRGTPIEQATDRDLEFVERSVRENLEGGQSRFPDRDRRLLDAILNEMDRRVVNDDHKIRY
ncbi:MAG TPA: hypothetical protein VGI39_01300 [Polyangiaceae bacterium]|jgi:hypothetical protein